MLNVAEASSPRAAVTSTFEMLSGGIGTVEG